MSKSNSRKANKKIEKMLEAEINKRKGKKGIGTKDDINSLESMLSSLTGEDIKVTDANDAKSILGNIIKEKSENTGEDDKYLSAIKKMARKAGIK